jgi:hypothetical protein
MQFEQLLDLRKSINVGPLVVIFMDYDSKFLTQVTTEEQNKLDNIKRYDSAHGLNACVLSFLVSNKGHPFYTSIFPLIPTILKMADLDVLPNINFKCNSSLKILFHGGSLSLKRKRTSIAS